MRHPSPIPSSRAPAGGWPAEAVLADFPLDEQTLVVLAQQPWASALDIAGRLQMSVSDIHKTCHELEGAKRIFGRNMGATRRMQQRYVLSRAGVIHVTQDFRYNGLIRGALPLTWQMTEEGVTRMLRWLPMIESLHEILPNFWTTGLASPFRWESTFSDPSCSSHVWMGIPTLMEVLWLPNGRLHAVATWRFERHGKRPRYHSVPFLWSGLLRQEEYKSRSLRLGSRYVRSARHPADQIWWDMEPPVVAICRDEFSAFRAKAAYGSDVQVASVDTAGALAWSAEASHAEWTVESQRPQARAVGHPEAAAIEEGPALANLSGIREYRALLFLCDFRAATKANLATAFHMSRGAVNTVVDHLIEQGMFTSVGKNLYITPRGKEALAALDRIEDFRLVEVTYLDPMGEDAVTERRHDTAVADVGAKFRGAGYPVMAGWRWVVPISDGQLVPDIWVRLPVPGREEGIWVAVEVEFSAENPKRIENKKLRSYRLAPVRLNQTYPLLVITGKALAAQRFDDLAGDLPMLTTTVREFLTGIWEGPESVWRRKGRPQGLSDLAGGHWPHLRQETGRSIDKNSPSFEVRFKLIMEESIWSDPQTEDFDAPLPPMGPKLSEVIRPVTNEATAEVSASKPVPATTPPPSYPAPVRKAPSAEDRALGRRQMLGRVNELLAVADEFAGRRLNLGGLSDADRLCLMRIKAIISYGSYRHNLGDGQIADHLLQVCLELQDEHHRAVRSGKPLWWLTESSSKSDPSQAFREILRKHPEGRRNACKAFNDWSKMVKDAAAAARRAWTLESDDPSGGSVT